MDPLEKIIQRHEGVIFAKSFCPHSRQAIEDALSFVGLQKTYTLSDAKRDLKKYKDVIVYFLDCDCKSDSQMEDIQKRLAKLSTDGETTVPRIWFRDIPTMQGIGADEFVRQVNKIKISPTMTGEQFLKSK